MSRLRERLAKESLKRQAILLVIGLVAILWGGLRAAPVYAHQVAGFAAPTLVESASGPSLDALRRWLQGILRHEVAFFSIEEPGRVTGALREGRIDLALLDPGDYAALLGAAEIKPIASIWLPAHSAVIVARKAALGALSDLRGKKLALGTFDSAAGHLQPMALVARAGLDPRRDIITLHVAPTVGWRALNQGDVAALAMAYRQFLELAGLDRQRLRILARGEPLPPDVLVAGPHLDSAALSTLRTAIERSPEALANLLARALPWRYAEARIQLKVHKAQYGDLRQIHRPAVEDRR